MFRKQSTQVSIVQPHKTKSWKKSVESRDKILRLAVLKSIFLFWAICMVKKSHVNMRK